MIAAAGNVPRVTASYLIPAACSAITSPSSIPAPIVINFDDLPDGAQELASRKRRLN